MEQEFIERLIPAEDINTSELRLRLQAGMVSYLLVASDAKWESILDSAMDPLSRLIVNTRNAFCLFDIEAQKENARKFYNSSAIAYPRIDPKDVPDWLRFGTGPADDGYLYVRHPYKKHCFLLPSKANRLVADEKLDVIKMVAALLGATSVKIQSLSQNKKGFTLLGIVGNALDAKSKAGADSTVSSEHDSEFVPDGKLGFEKNQELATMLGQVGVPIDIHEWILRDNDIYSIAVQRLLGRAKKISVKFESSRTLEIDSNFRSKLPSNAIGIGGNIETVEKNSWACEIKFEE